jgi:hypothetical protein
MSNFTVPHLAISRPTFKPSVRSCALGKLRYKLINGTLALSIVETLGSGDFPNRLKSLNYFCSHYVCFKHKVFLKKFKLIETLLYIKGVCLKK